MHKHPILGEKCSQLLHVTKFKKNCRCSNCWLNGLCHSRPLQKKRKSKSVCVLPLIIVFCALIIQALNNYLSVTTADVTQGDKKVTFSLHVIFA